MELLETVIGLLLVAALLASLADRIGVPYPALLALAGVGMAFIPGVPVVTPDPALALGSVFKAEARAPRRQGPTQA
jgi:monovalent cation/hydrogen antiporter